jgi:hypothetical protein
MVARERNGIEGSCTQSELKFDESVVKTDCLRLLGSYELSSNLGILKVFWSNIYSRQYFYTNEELSELAERLLEVVRKHF